MTPTTGTADNLYKAERTVEAALGDKKVHYNGKVYDIADPMVYPNKKTCEQDFQLIQASPYVSMRNGIVPPCNLVFDESLTSESFYRGSSQTIHLASGWAMTKFTLLHEYAHHIVGHTGYTDSDVHGPLFVSVFCHLLNDLLGGQTGDLLMDLKG